MTQLRIGFNINGANAGDTAAIVHWHRDNKPAWALVMDSAGLADDIKFASPTTNVIIRSYPDTGHENTFKMLTPEAFLTVAIEQQAHRDLWIQVGNESGFSDDLLNWTARVIELAAVYNQTASQPLKLVILNHAVGTPQPAEWKWSPAVKVLTLASKYREWCAIGLHEYFNIVPTSGFRGGKPTWIQPGEWPEVPQNTGALWHCGRFEFALEACRENGIAPYPRMVLTEHGTDDVSDVKQWVESFGQGTGRGWKHAAKLWALPSFYPGQPKEEVFARMLHYLDDHLYSKSPVEGQLIFTLSKSPDWAAFDASEMLGHITAPVDDAPPTPPPPPPPVVDIPPHLTNPVQGVNRTPYAVRIRAQGNDDAAQIGSIAPKAVFTYYPATSVEDIEYTWVFVETGDLRGWSALEALGIDNPPPVEPPPDNSEQWAALAERVNALEVERDDLIEKYGKLVNALKAFVSVVDSL